MNTVFNRMDFHLASPPAKALQRHPNPVVVEGWIRTGEEAAFAEAPGVRVRIASRLVTCETSRQPDPSRPDAHLVRFRAEFSTRPGIKLLRFEAHPGDGRWRAADRRLLWVSARGSRYRDLDRAGDDLALPFAPETQPAPEPHVRAIAFYLPQFHAIPENDWWWGPGFTEWTNVRPATPRFPGHHQPHVPHPSLGHYDLGDPEVLEKQARMAREAGVYGFCYYYYWFGGKRLLEMPLERMLASGRPDMPFCYCWANENWSRRWDGQDAEILIAQNHSREDDEAVIRDLVRALRDPRYIRVNGKPLLLVYRPALLPHPRATFALWREICRDSGVGEIQLAGVKGFGCNDPEKFGLDALVEFPPNDSGAPQIAPPAGHAEGFAGKIYDYRAVRRLCLGLHRPDRWTLYRGVTPSWDNTARRKDRGSIFLNSSPGAFMNWLRVTADRAAADRDPEQRILFINAWNEWAEGCHLEPDERDGYAWLNATRRVLGSWRGARVLPPFDLPAAPRIVLSALFYHREDLIPRWVESFQAQAADHLARHGGSCLLAITLNYPAPAGLAADIRARFAAGPRPPGLALEIHEPGFNQGFGPGHNAIFARHESDVFVAVNSDLIVPRSDWLSAAVERMRETRADMVGPAANAARLRPDGCGLDAEAPRSEGFDYIDGSLLLIRSEAARRLGLFAPGYRYFYFEDADLGLRFRQAGARLELIDLPCDHARSSSALTLPRPLMENVLAHNRAKFAETWGGYLPGRKLGEVLAVRWTSQDLAQQLAAIPALLGLLSEHPGGKLLLVGAHPRLGAFLAHPRIILIAAEATGDASGFHRDHTLERLDERTTRGWTHEIARRVGVDIDEDAARAHLAGLAADAAPPPAGRPLLVLADRDPLLAGATPPEAALREVAAHADVLFDGPAYARPDWAADARLLSSLSAAELIAATTGASAVIGAPHWTIALAQLLQRPVFLWQGSVPTAGLVWRWSAAGVFRPRGLDCLGCRASLGRPEELVCLRGDEACVSPDHAADFLAELKAFLAAPASPRWLDAAWTSPPLASRRADTQDGAMLARWQDSIVDDVLVLIPHSPAAPASRLKRARELAERALRGMRRSRVVLDSEGTAPPRGNHPTRQTALAAIRQGMVDRHLRAERWILWVDDDIVDYPESLVRDLARRAEGGIAAPVVLMEGEPDPDATNAHGFGPGRFFDVAGFVEKGRWASFDQPWFEQPGPAVDLDSVGSCYLVPAELYRRGARHAADPRSEAFLASGTSWPEDAVARGQRGEALAFTEHYSVCAFAKAQGLPVRAFTDLRALHQRI